METSSEVLGPRRRLPKRTKEQTRQLMLRAALDLLRERALSQGDDVVAAALAHVRITDIAARATQLVRADLAADVDDRVAGASVTAGAAYQVWPRQADLQADLLFHIAELQATLGPAPLDAVRDFAASAAAGVPLEEALADTVEQIWRLYRDDPIFRIELSFLVAAVDPRVRAALAHRRRRFAAAADVVWQGLLDAYGLQLRAPYRLQDLTSSVSAQIVGSVVLWWAEPELLDDPFGAGRSLAGRAIELLVRNLTEPVPTG